MTLQELFGILKEGGPSAFAAIFLWLFLSERKAHNLLQAEWRTDVRSSTDALHKSTASLDKAISFVETQRDSERRLS